MSHLETFGTLTSCPRCERVAEVSGDIGWTRKTSFFEELRVQVLDPDTGEEWEHVMQVPCCRKPEGDESRVNEEDMERLEALLQAHEKAVVGQRAR